MIFNSASPISAQVLVDQRWQAHKKAVEKARRKQQQQQLLELAQQLSRTTRVVEELSRRQSPHSQSAGLSGVLSTMNPLKGWNASNRDPTVRNIVPKSMA